MSAEIPELPVNPTKNFHADPVARTIDFAMSSEFILGAGITFFDDQRGIIGEYVRGKRPDIPSAQKLVSEASDRITELDGMVYCETIRDDRNVAISYLYIDQEKSKETKSFIDHFFRLIRSQFSLLTDIPFKTLVENINDLIFEIDEIGQFTYVNPEFCEVTGFGREELLSMSLNDILVKKNLKEILMGVKYSTEEEPSIQDCEFLTADDPPYTIKVELRVQKVDFGSRSRIVGVARDITDREESELLLQMADTKLTQYKEGLRLLNEISANRELSPEQQIEGALGICTEFLSLKTGILSSIENGKLHIDYIYNSGAPSFEKDQTLELPDTFSDLAWSKEEVVAIEHVSATTYKVHPAYENFQIESFIGVPYFMGGTKKGTLSFSSTDPRKDRFENNEYEFVRLLSRWISFMLQHQEFERKLMADKMILQAFVSSAPAAIAMLDKDLNFITASDKWYQDYDIEDEYIIGRNYFDVITESGQDWKIIFQKALKGSMEHNDQDLIEKDDGEIQWIKWEVRPWFEKLEVVGGLIMFTEDITQQKEQQLQLKIAKRRAEQASKAKEQFLSTMSHEIRTPLNAIIGMTEVMLMDQLTEEQERHLNLLKFSGENLLVLINDILDFNKIEAGKLELEVVNFDFVSILEKINESMSGLVEQKGLEFKLEIDPDIPKYVKGDPVRLGQVINNLVNNAIKFTEKGYIRVDAKAIYVGADMCTIEVKVTDSGIGIAPDKLETIFQSFTQANTRITRKYGGSGLGLSISRKILALMSSNLEVNSTVGQGSTFFFKLEMKMGDKVAPGNEPGTTMLKIRKDLKILVAEDNEGNRILMKSLFKRWGIDFDFAHDGLEAVEKVSSKEYDMILMDLQMPEMDGYEATINIRNREEKYFKDLPIVALTASVMSNVLEQAKEVGMNAYVSKPFDPKYLREVIASHTGFFAKDNKPEEPEIISLSKIDANEFPYLRDLIGDDPESLKEIISTTVQSIKTANKGVQKAVLENDIDKVRAEIHILRPNLHNLELGQLINDFPQVRELTDENIKLIHELTQKINNALNSPRLTIFM